VADGKDDDDDDEELGDLDKMTLSAGNLEGKEATHQARRRLEDCLIPTIEKKKRTRNKELACLEGFISMSNSWTPER
jgi:hypothetical protein